MIQKQAAAPLQTNYQRILGNAWHSVPAQIQVMHNWESALSTEGRAQIERGGGVLSRLIGAVFDFPKAGQDVPVTVRFHQSEASEVWTRTFADKTFFSVQAIGQGRCANLIDETFGPFTFGLALTFLDGKVHLAVRNWRLQWGFLRLPLPLAWAAKTVACEYVEQEKYRFDIEINHPLAGLIVRYRGWLVPLDSAK